MEIVSFLKMWMDVWNEAEEKRLRMPEEAAAFRKKRRGKYFFYRGKKKEDCCQSGSHWRESTGKQAGESRRKFLDGTDRKTCENAGRNGWNRDGENGRNLAFANFCGRWYRRRNPAAAAAMAEKRKYF